MFDHASAARPRSPFVRARLPRAAGLAAVALLALPGAASAVQQQRLLTGDGAADDNAGRSVAIQGDTAVVGAPGAADGTGAVYVYERSAGTWTQTGKLTASDGLAGDGLGTSVAIDANTIVAGARGVDDDFEDQGAVYRFDRTGTANRTETGRMLAADPDDGNALGFSVAIDGQTIVAGASGGDEGTASGPGAAYTFDASTLAQTAKLTASDGASFDMLGSAVALDGATIVVGARGDDAAGTNFNTGSIYTFARTGAATRTQTAKLTATGQGRFDELGQTVAIEGDTIVGGAAGRDIGGAPNFGFAYTFATTGAAARNQTARLSASDGQEFDELGTSVAIEGSTIVVGVPGSSYDDAFDFGAVYTFTRTGATTRTQKAKYIAPDGEPIDKLGTSVAIDGGRIIAGAPLDDDGDEFDQGSAVILQPNGSLPGVVTLSTGWGLRDSLSAGISTTTFAYGTRPLVPIMGDWDGDGLKTPGTFEGGTFKLSNTIAPGAPTVTVTFGDARGFPVVGDYNGDGTDDLAVYRAGVWEVRIVTGGTPQTHTVSFGTGTWPATVPVAGDWDGDGTDGIGMFTAGTWTLRATALVSSTVSTPFTYAPATGAYPVVGDWDADGDDTVGVRAGGIWLLNDANDASAPERTFAYGAANDFPVVWRQADEL